MPIYDFRCEQHGGFEDIVAMDTRTQPCPECGAESKKMISGAAVVNPKFIWFKRDVARRQDGY